MLICPTLKNHDVLHECLSIMDSSFRFKYRGLHSGTYPVELLSFAEELDMPTFFGEVTAKGTVKVAEQIHFHLLLSAEGNFTCDRCGKEFTRVINGELNVNFVPLGLDNEEIDDVYVHIYDPVKSSEIDLREDIRDTILISVPMKNICGDDCPGFTIEQFEPEETENIARLRRLMEKMKEGE